MALKTETKTKTSFNKISIGLASPEEILKIIKRRGPQAGNNKLPDL